MKIDLQKIETCLERVEPTLTGEPVQPDMSGMHKSLDTILASVDPASPLAKAIKAAKESVTTACNKAAKESAVRAQARDAVVTESFEAIRAEIANARGDNMKQLAVASANERYALIDELFIGAEKLHEVHRRAEALAVKLTSQGVDFCKNLAPWCYGFPGEELAEWIEHVRGLGRSLHSDAIRFNN